MQKGRGEGRIKPVMAVPKYRPSSQRQGRRRSQHQIKLPELSECQFCGALKRPHFACPSCGKYGKELNAEGEKPKAKSKKIKKKKDDKTKTKKAKGSKA